MKRRKKIEQKVGKTPVHLPASRNSMSAIVALLAYTYHTEKRIEKLLGKPMKALVHMPVLRNELAHHDAEWCSANACGSSTANAERS